MEFLETTLWNSPLRLPRSSIQGTHASCNMGYVWFQGPYVFFVSSDACVVLLQIDLTKWYGPVTYPLAMQCSVAPWCVVPLRKLDPLGVMGGLRRHVAITSLTVGVGQLNETLRLEKEKEAITYQPLRLTFPFMVSCQSCAPPRQDQWLMASAQGHRQLMS